MKNIHAFIRNVRRFIRKSKKLPLADTITVLLADTTGLPVCGLNYGEGRYSYFKYGTEIFEYYRTASFMIDRAMHVLPEGGFIHATVYYTDYKDADVLYDNVFMRPEALRNTLCSLFGCR